MSLDLLVTDPILDTEWEPGIPQPSIVTLRKEIDSLVVACNSLSPELFQFNLSRVLWRVECTDAGNAVRFAARYGRDVHFVAERGKWLVWNGRQWLEDEKRLIVQYAEQVAAYLEQEAARIPGPRDSQGNLLVYPQLALLDIPTPEQREIIKQFDDHDKQVEALKKWGKSSQSKRAIDAMIELLKSEPGVTVLISELDSDDYLVNMPDGTFDLRTGSLLPHDREHLCTKITSVTARASSPIPRWQKFMETITEGDQELIRFHQQVLGMGLCGAVMDDMLVINWGAGGNGKGVFYMTVLEAYGGYAKTASKNLLVETRNEKSDNEEAGLVGVRFLVANEIKDGARLDESQVKSLMSGETITARFLFKEYFTYQTKFTAVLNTNHKPIVKGADKGIWRRLKLVPWAHDFEADPEHKDKPTILSELRQELPGILAWCIAGYQDRVQHGLVVPTAVTDATSQYKETSDIIGAFLTEKCIITPNAEVSKAALFTVYQNFMQEAGLEALGKPRFGDKLRERGIEDGRTGAKGWFWKGIRLRTDADALEPEPPKEEEPKRQFVPPPAVPPYQYVPAEFLEKRECFVCHEMTRVYDLARLIWYCEQCGAGK